MGLETGTFISDLNASNPVGASDPKSQGDDHIRLVKSTILASFTGITGAMTLTHLQLNQAAIKNEVNTLTLALIAANPAAVSLADNNAPLLVGVGAGQHIEMDGGDIQGKATATTQGDLSINALGGTLSLGPQSGTGETHIYNAGLRVLETRVGGVAIRGSLSGALGGNQNSNVVMRTGDGVTDLAILNYLSTPHLHFRNLNHGGNIRIEAEDAAGVNQKMIECNPDGNVDIYEDGLLRLTAQNAGVVGVVSDGNTDTETRLLEFFHQDKTLRGFCGYNGAGTLRLENRIHGASITLASENAAGVLKNLLSADPDGDLLLYRAGVNTAKTVSVAGGALKIADDTSTFRHVAKYITQITAINLPSLAAKAISNQDITVTGAVVGDAVVWNWELTPTEALDGISVLNCYVVAANLVRVNFFNFDTATHNLIERDLVLTVLRV